MYTQIDWSKYVSVVDGTVRIRANRGVDWADATDFTLAEAEGLADYLKTELDKHVRNSRAVQDIIADLEESSDTGRGTWEDIALALYRRGYRKP